MAFDPAFRRVASRQNPIVARFRALTRSTRAAEVLVEGTTLAAEALAAGWVLEVIAATEGALADSATARLVARAPAAERLVVTAAVMEALSPAKSPSGLVAIARPPVPIETVSAFDGAQTSARCPLVVCAADVQDPGNFGAIVRVAEAAGATGVLAAGTSADPLGPKALRGAMGSAFRLPIVRRIEIDAAVALARRSGWQVVATVLDGTPPDGVDLIRPTCLFVGAEGAGLPPAVVAGADARLAIPMETPVESLNVAVATAVVLYEARRQRLAISPETVRRGTIP